MKRKSRVLFLSFIVLLVAGCFSSNVDVVKGSTMVNYESTTVGKAFEGSFDDPIWTEFETKKGHKVVEFTGNISQSLHESASQKLYNELKGQNPYPVLIQLKQVMGEDFDKYAVGETTEDKTEAVLKAFAENYCWKVGTPVKVQWLISNDGESFEIDSMSSDAWNGYELTDIMDLIYS